MTKLTKKIENLENYYCPIKRELNLHRCFDMIKEIEAIIELLSKKNQQKYLQKVESLFSLYSVLVDEA